MGGSFLAVTKTTPIFAMNAKIQIRVCGCSSIDKTKGRFWYNHFSILAPRLFLGVCHCVFLHRIK